MYKNNDSTFECDKLFFTESSLGASKMSNYKSFIKNDTTIIHPISLKYIKSMLKSQIKNKFNNGLFVEEEEESRKSYLQESFQVKKDESFFKNTSIYNINQDTIISNFNVCSENFPNDEKNYNVLAKVEFEEICAINIQSLFRGFIIRNSVKKKSKAAKQIIKQFREYVERKKFFLLMSLITKSILNGEEIKIKETFNVVMEILKNLEKDKANLLISIRIFTKLFVKIIKYTRKIKHLNS